MYKKGFKYLSLSLFASILLFGCGSGESGSSSSSNLTHSISGIIVDGYIKDAIVCLDKNLNGLCEKTEPKTTSKEDGTFIFLKVKVEANKFYPVISKGGIDTATGETFYGELKNIITSEDITLGKQLSVSPITDLIATTFLESPKKDSSALETTKENISLALNLTKEEIDKDPMQDKKVFAKAQEIQQVKTLIEKSSQKANGSKLTSKQKNSITLALVEQINENSTLDISKVLTNIETNLKISIPTNEKSFIQDQAVELKKHLESINSDNTSTEKLNEIQKSLETKLEKANEIITNAKETDILEKVKLSNNLDKVKDTQAPILSSTNKTFTTTLGSPLNLEIVTAKDNKDKNVKVVQSGNVDFNAVGTYNITYTASDKAGNKSSITHTYVVKELSDTQAPILSSTNKTFTTTLGSPLNLEIVTAKDNKDKNVQVVQSGNIDFNAVGTYNITYTASDKAGNKSSITHTYVVKKIEYKGGIVIPKNIELPKPPIMPNL